MRKADKRGVARRVRLRREKVGLSQGQLAHAVGMSQQGIDNIEHEKVGRPREILALAAALLTTPEWILHERGPEVLRPANPIDEIVALAGEIGADRLGAVLQFMKTLTDEADVA